MNSSPPFDEKLCLALEPFAGDFGAPGDKILSDKICRCRRQLKASWHLCGLAILPGTFYRRCAAIYDEAFSSFVWCSDCCAAMAKSWDWHNSANSTSKSSPMDARYKLRSS